jgi:hypothetical protein
MSFRKCGTCIHFFVKPNEVEIARHAPDISKCQPGMPHCLGGQVRGGCAVWQERAEKGMKMPWGDGPMVENTFGCKLWERGGPSVKQVGSFSKIEEKIKTGLSNHPFYYPMGAIGVVLLTGLAKKFKSGSMDQWITREGKLGGKGFLSKPRSEQHKLLKNSVKKYGYRSTLGSIMVLERSHVIDQRHGEELEELRDWLKDTFGGEGSYE